MYYQNDQEQLSMEEYFQPFGGRLRKNNRWVCLAAIMPWEYIEKVHMKNMSGETGRPAISSRIAFGAIFIKEYRHITGDDTVQQLQKNSYMQYFVGCTEFHAKPLFDPSMVQDYENLFPRWLRDRLAVIPAVYRQTMYDNHTHSCEDRIVSLEQPHVRPIQRGKRPNPTEFGQKLHLSVVNGYTFLIHFSAGMRAQKRHRFYENKGKGR